MATQKVTTNGNHNPPSAASPAQAAPKAKPPETRVDSSDGFESSTAVTRVWVPKAGEARVCVYGGEVVFTDVNGKEQHGFEVKDKSLGTVYTVSGPDASRMLVHLRPGEEVRISRGRNVSIGKGISVQSYDFGMRPETRARVDRDVKAADERARAERAAKDSSKA